MTERSIEHASFTIERTYSATPPKVFAAWADPVAKRRWFVEDLTWKTSEYEFDFRVGGREHGRFQGEDGPAFINDTVYLDIVPDQRIAFAYSMSTDDGPFSASLVTVDFQSDGDGTKLVFTEQGAFFDGFDQPTMRQTGWGWLFDALDRALGETRG